MAFLWKRVRIASALPVAEVQERLATATAGWSGDFRGSAVPRPPWEQAAFVACQGAASAWLSIPLVVVGEVHPQGEGSRLTAVIRPHGLNVATLVLASVLFPGAALLAVGPAVGIFSFACVASAASVLLWVNVAEKSPRILDALAAACDAARTALAAPSAR